MTDHTPQSIAKINVHALVANLDRCGACDVTKEEREAAVTRVLAIYDQIVSAPGPVTPLCLNEYHRTLLGCILEQEQQRIENVSRTADQPADREGHPPATSGTQPRFVAIRGSGPEQRPCVGSDQRHREGSPKRERDSNAHFSFEADPSGVRGACEDVAGTLTAPYEPSAWHMSLSLLAAIVIGASIGAKFL